ncbi:hypothetical protein NIES4075_51280 [Tolypothrix sp. NIES-4075]|uniref:hypothetical protein n=1 Tax=Tolypothrix sp. NIES-4075 TaxID=2005459 RepID=UPI000B5CCD54|nr:hypothetical protein [Tolypothrix sp. NIES-4075]GAX44111.1 hypothetical protein NIES4075_51280 [Tolypothrix sp. NIES-4075]
MKRFILAGLSAVLIVAAIVPAVKAQTLVQRRLTTFNPAVTNKASTSQLTPFDLVYLAYRGYLGVQGIPSYNSLILSHEFGRISAKDVVQSAVKANRLSEETLADKSYLRAVEDQLTMLDKD